VESADRQLGLDRCITRRDFLNGVALGVGGSLASAGLTACGWSLESAARFEQDRPASYPPALTGLRGSHDGSWEPAHALRDGTFWQQAGAVIDTRETYDLVVVGGGISGLAAAYFFRQRAGNDARILILDNHDDFGGHATRNEFSVGGRLLLGNGGTQSIATPTPYSLQARGLLTALGIDPPALTAQCLDRQLFAALKPAVFFNKETFGEDCLVARDPTRPWAEFLARTPLSTAARCDIERLQEALIDYLPGLSSAAKKDRLSRLSYKDFLLHIAQVHPDVIPFYQTRTHGLYGIGIDAVPALDCWGIGLPGFQGLSLEPGPAPRMSHAAAGAATPNREPYRFHFPDGNASIARLLVRTLVPEAVPGHTVEDLVTAQIDYARLDRPGAAVRIRLGSLAVRARQVGRPGSSHEVAVYYAREQRVYAVHGRGCVLACWNMVIPSLCPELPEKQKEALMYGAKVPLVYTNVALRHWTAFHQLGVRTVAAPGCFHHTVSLHEPVSIGTHRYASSPEEPVVLRLVRTPCNPGLPAREQHRSGRLELLNTPFSTFERHIRNELGRMLAPAGFDPARDIVAITVNRWPHGYAYEYNPLWDPEWAPDEQPCVLARQPFGRITIANADAAAYAYTDAAIDQGYRAVQELFTIWGSSTSARHQTRPEAGALGGLLHLEDSR
jgi:spermidine dehydrogenase